ncbi:hypothetical protein F5884DRAFT_180921 [Xylogone sp. PMI_703]|nr:hypothetical protein F5884DRAFT_180921 [Xylogone sp. PMI_703]
MDISDTANTPLSNGLTAPQIDNVLSTRRRKSYPKACYPCRRRKVRCDREEPCNNCVKYSHPQLCSYSARDRIDRRAPAHAQNSSYQPLNDRLATLESRMEMIAEQVVRRLGSAGFGHPDALSSQSPSSTDGEQQIAVPGDTRLKNIGTGVYLGAESIASAIMDIITSTDTMRNLSDLKIRNEDKDLSSRQVMKLLCMEDTGETFLFANLWRPGVTVQEICFALPDDASFYRYLDSFQSLVHLFIPSGPIKPLQSDAKQFWQERLEGKKSELELRPTSWLAILFGALAFGCCFGDRNAADELNSNVFACCAFALLRIDNFLLRPELNHIYALSLLGGCLRAQSKPLASWSLLGLTIRLAQSIGLHCTPLPDEKSSPSEREAWDWWQGIVWQDTTTSLVYDRPCISFNDASVPRIARATEGGLSYVQCCHGQATTMNDISYEIAAAKRTRVVLPTVRFDLADEQIHLYEVSAQEHLRIRSYCKSNFELIQHDAFRVYTNYFLFQLRRHRYGFEKASQTQSTPTTDPLCIQHCQAVLQAYVTLRKLSPRGSRLWLLVHIALSCAYFLGTNPRIGEDDFSISLIQQLCDTQEPAVQSSVHPHYPTTLEALKRLIDDNEVAVEPGGLTMTAALDPQPSAS